MQKLLRRLKKEGFVRAQGETMSNFLNKVAKKEKRFEELKVINILYHEGRYAKDKVHILDQLRTQILSFIKRLKT